MTFDYRLIPAIIIVLAMILLIVGVIVVGLQETKKINAYEEFCEDRGYEFKKPRQCYKINRDQVTTKDMTRIDGKVYWAEEGK